MPTRTRTSLPARRSRTVLLLSIVVLLGLFSFENLQAHANPDPDNTRVLKTREGTIPILQSEFDLPPSQDFTFRLNENVDSMTVRLDYFTPNEPNCDNPQVSNGCFGKKAEFTLTSPSGVVWHSPNPAFDFESIPLAYNGWNIPDPERGKWSVSVNADSFYVWYEIPFTVTVLVPPKMCQGQVVTIDMNTNGGNGVGTAGDDVILGTNSGDVIRGRGGDDTICSGGGADDVDGGSGNDSITAGGGNDTVDGGTGDDEIDGNDGRDTLNGDDGRDRIRGGRGNDVINGGEGKDNLSGGADNDVINGGKRKDKIYGNNGNDLLFGDGGNDKMYGGANDDELRGGGGADDMSGGDGNDVCKGQSGSPDTADFTCEVTGSIP